MELERTPVSLVEEIFVDGLEEVEEVGRGVAGGGWGGHDGFW